MKIIPLLLGIGSNDHAQLRFLRYSYNFVTEFVDFRWSSIYKLHVSFVHDYMIFPYIIIIIINHCFCVISAFIIIDLICRYSDRRSTDGTKELIACEDFTITVSGRSKAHALSVLKRVLGL